MRVDRLVYISGPITPKNGYMIEENVRVGLHAHLELTRLGVPSICPQLVGGFPSAWHVDWKQWMALDMAIINHCTDMLMLPRWEDSLGACEERDYALAKGIWVAYSIPELMGMLEPEGR